MIIFLIWSLTIHFYKSTVPRLKKWPKSLIALHNSSTGKHRQNDLCVPACSTEQVPGQSRLHKEILSKKTNKRYTQDKKKKKQNNNTKHKNNKTNKKNKKQKEHITRYEPSSTFSSSQPHVKTTTAIVLTQLSSIFPLTKTLEKYSQD